MRSKWKLWIKSECHNMLFSVMLKFHIQGVVLEYLIACCYGDFWRKILDRYGQYEVKVNAGVIC